MNRRSLIVAAAVPALAAAASRIPVSGLAGAQPAAEPAVDPRLADYPRFVVTLGEDRITAPATVAAGPTLLIEEAAGEGPSHAFVLRVPDDLSDEALAEGLRGSAPVEETPEWFWRSTFVGNGDRARAGKPGVALVELQPGRYVVGDPYRPANQFAVFEATGEGSALPDIEPDVRADLFEMGFELPATVAAGRQVWEVSNTGAMLHEIAIMPVPTGATPEDVEAAASADLGVHFGGDPAVARAAIDAIGPGWKGWNGVQGLVAGLGVLSPQRTSYAQFDFVPGTYGAVCYVPEPTSMTPHVMFGMTAVFTVADQPV